MSEASQNATLGTPAKDRGDRDRPTKREAYLGKPTSPKPLKTDR